MQRLLPDAQLAVLPFADHMTVVARADDVAALVQQFLGRPQGAFGAKCSVYAGLRWF